MDRFVRRLMSIIGLVALLVGALAAYAPAQAADTPDPSSVTLVGSLQSELGCPGDWDPTCGASFLSYDGSDRVWQGSWTLAAGAFEYKVALNQSWDENYGANAARGGANIGLTLGADTAVKFYYDHETHWVADNVNKVIAVAPGSFQSELGCPGDWDPSCLRSWLQDPDGDGVYTFETTSLPIGVYEGKVAINEGWDENYGAGGVSGGANIPFTVSAAGQRVAFSYVAATHILTIIAGHGADNNVEWNGLKHDSRDLTYRTPGGAVGLGTPVKLRLRTFHNDVTGVSARIFSVDRGQSILPMSIAASDVSCYDSGLANETCDFWEITLPNAALDNLWYRFIVSDGSDVDYYADNTPALDGGLGAVSEDPVDNSYALMVYDPGFESPAWVSRSVIYQIFPDRFRNGSLANDPKTGQERYDDPMIKMKWGSLPEGYCRNYADAATNCPWRFDATPPDTSPTKEQPRGRDYYGGDLKGVIAKLGYLRSIGVTTIYFNPVFAAKSNHRYDTADYTRIDPNLGSNADFKTLVYQARKHGINIVLDGVFNHLSSDSAFFDRYHHYQTVGACESLSSPYRDWFVFRDVPAGTGTCVGTAGENSATYTGWFGFDSIPEINKSNPTVQAYFLTDPNSISRQWIDRGAAGWRMDVMGDASFPNGYWETFRQVVKDEDPNTVIIGELWQKDSTLLRFLRGDRADTTMNYRMRDAVIGLLVTGAFDSKGFADSGRKLLPSEFASRILSIREDTPDAAYYAMMNLLDSHDTERLLWTLTPGADTTAEKELNAANLAEGKLRMKLASLIQFTMPGAPTIYYGDEAGMTGDDDPDDRRTFPWPDQGGKPDTSLTVHYRKLATMRKSIPSLANGDLRMLLVDDTQQLLSYGRKNGDGATLVAINLGTTRKEFDIPVAGYLPEGMGFTNVYRVGAAPDQAVNVRDGMVNVTLDGMSAVMFAASGVKLALPAAPTGLGVSEGQGEVTLSWSPVAKAAGYNVYRSPLSGGGYIKVNPTLLSGTTFTDTGLRNAQLYYYVVRAADTRGMESEASAEVSALPHLNIGWANLQWPPTLTHTINVVNRTENVYGQVWIDNATNQPGATPNLRAQLGYGPEGSNPAGNSAWTWVDASFNVNAGNNDEFMASLLPEAVGTFDYVYRYSTTNGRDWLYADVNGPIPAGATPPNPGKLTVNPSGDTTAPAVPSGLVVTSASPAGINLAWDALLGDASLYGYEVLRSSTAGGPYAKIGTVTANSFSDLAVAEGATYYYVIRALDTSFNRSGNSAEVTATAQLRTVTLTFNVSVPATTDATGRSVYIAGFLDRLDGGLPQWNPGGVVLTRVDATHWTITLTGKEGTGIDYKYTLGDWDHVEKGAACDEIGNRLLTLSYGANGTQVVDDAVLNWRNVAPCGN